jgi:hypothetical protein
VPKDVEGDTITLRARFDTGPLAGTLEAIEELALEH